MKSLLASLVVGAALVLAGCGGGSGSSSISTPPAPAASLPPTFTASIVLAQPNGAPAANATLYSEVANCTAGAAFCQASLVMGSSGTATLVVVPTETYCFSTSGFIAPSSALNPAQFETITAGGPIYEALPGCVAISAQQTTYYFVE